MAECGRRPHGQLEELSGHDGDELLGFGKGENGLYIWPGSRDLRDKIRLRRRSSPREQNANAGAKPTIERRASAVAVNADRAFEQDATVLSRPDELRERTPEAKPITNVEPLLVLPQGLL